MGHLGGGWPGRKLLRERGCPNTPGLSLGVFFFSFSSIQVSKVASSEGEELYDQVLETAESFRHILYHILEQQKFFRYVGPVC